MPERVSDGPRIPAHLMNEVDADSAVFFCGNCSPGVCISLKNP